jgi:hypothetical protein
MGPDRSAPGETSGDHDRFVAHGLALVDAVDVAIEEWVVAAVRARAHGLDEQAADAAARCRHDIVPRLRALVVLDLDSQPTTPLEILRNAGSYPTAVLAAAGVAPIRRDDFDERRDPDDVYGVAPVAFADLGAAVGAAGIVWGAAKAHVHLARRRR